MCDGSKWILDHKRKSFKVRDNVWNGPGAESNRTSELWPRHLGVSPSPCRELSGLSCIATHRLLDEAGVFARGDSTIQGV
jgi:hypothetical protein